MDERLLAALRVMFARDKKGLEGKTAKQLGRYKVCNNNTNCSFLAGEQRVGSGGGLEDLL